MIWLLDDMVLDHLSRVTLSQEAGTPPEVRLLITSTTAASAEQSEMRKNWLQECDFAETIRVLLGNDDPAAQILVELHGEEKTTINQAEREAIAWALVHGQDAVFVTTDKRATVTALAELGRERVAHPFDLWLDLLDREMLSPTDFRALCELTRRKDQGLERMPDRVQKRLR